MRDGRIVQAGDAGRALGAPADEEVARFLGLANVRDDGEVVVGPRRCGSARPRGGVVERPMRPGPVVQLRVRLDDGRCSRQWSRRSTIPAPAIASRSTIDPEGHRSASDDSPPRRRPRARAGRVLSRHATRPRACRRLTGWVRNTREGTVEAVFEGTADAVDTLVSISHNGPRGARVDRVEVFDEEPEGLDGFSIR